MAMTSHMLLLLAVGILLSLKLCRTAAGLPTDCTYIKFMNPSSESGVYEIQPPGHKKFKVFCDMSESIAWTKILQISEPYNITRDGFGDITTSRCEMASAKLSDAQINAIRKAREACGETGVVHYRLTAEDTSDRIYIKAYKKEFNDLSIAWNILKGERQQCFTSSLEQCTFKYFKTTHRTLDTYYDGSNSGSTRSWFMGNSPQRRCYIPSSPKRCVSRGDTYGRMPHNQVELWIGK